MKATRTVRLAPLALIPAAAVVAAIAIPASAGAAVPDRTPAQVLKLAASAHETTFSGVVETSAALGLPDLSSLTGSSSSSASKDSPLSWLTGDRTVRIYSGGPTKQRIQVLDQMAERDVVRNGTTVWTWDSASKKAVETTLPSREGAARHSMPDPSSLAQRFLTAAGPTTAVTLGAQESVAGRSAYDLVLTPKQSGTLVKNVQVAVDAATGMPLRVEITAKGQSSPAVEVGYRSIDYGTPSSSLFDFTPPAGATVARHEVHRPSAAQVQRWKAAHAGAASAAAAHRPTTTGSGWSTIVTIPAAAVPGGSTQSKQFLSLSTPVAGGRAVSTALVTVFVTDDGRVLAGSVPLSALQAAAG